MPTEEEKNNFKEACLETQIDPQKHILVHAAYIINLANPDAEKRARYMEHALKEIQKCEELGIGLYNIHPGATLFKPANKTIVELNKKEEHRKQGVKTIAECVNHLIKNSSFITIVLETTAGHGSTIGNTFQDLAQIIEAVEDKTRIGVCIDTCHLLAAGYDIRTAEKIAKVMDEFSAIVGFSYLRGMHLNDCSKETKEPMDRHAHIGEGRLGETPFRYLMNDPRLDEIPLILETPSGDRYKQEIQMLHSFIV